MSRAWEQAARRGLALLFPLGVAAIIWLRYGTLDPLALADAIRAHPLAPAIFVAVQVIAGLLFVPRTVTGIAAGLIFGPLWGFSWLMLATIIASGTGFLLARYVKGGSFEPEAWARLGPLLVRAEDWGWRGVAAFRLIPGIPYSLTNYALGLTRVRFDHYLTGSLIGQVPSSVVYMLLSTGGELLLGRATWLTAGIDAAILLVLGAVVVLGLRRAPLRGRSTPSDSHQKEPARPRCA